MLSMREPKRYNVMFKRDIVAYDEDHIKKLVKELYGLAEIIKITCLEPEKRQRRTR